MNKLNSGPGDLLKPIETSLMPGSAVYMTGFVDLTEIYVRKLEDHNDEFETLLEMVNTFCQSGIHILYYCLLTTFNLLLNHMF